MKRPFLYTLDYSESILSTFDISGSLTLGAVVKSKGIEHDINMLRQDHNILVEDYRNAYERIAKTMKDPDNE